MNTAGELCWPADSLCLHSSPGDVSQIARDVWQRTCRTDFDEPGFCVVNLTGDVDSHSLRRAMVELKRAMGILNEAHSGRALRYLSLGRFDQQTTTKPHLDGGPDECFLMLGYEPSDVESELEIFDYSRCAFDLGITPKQFMDRHNPMFQAGYDLLRPYSTRVPCFSPREFQIICINNSSARYSSGVTWQGTLHTATVHDPDVSKRRVINSTMIASVEQGTAASVSIAEQQQFVQTSLVRRRGHDLPDVADDG